jgi:hypothetical protein
MSKQNGSIYTMSNIRESDNKEIVISFDISD